MVSLMAFFSSCRPLCSENCVRASGAGCAGGERWVAVRQESEQERGAVRNDVTGEGRREGGRGAETDKLPSLRKLLSPARHLPSTAHTACFLSTHIERAMHF